MSRLLAIPLFLSAVLFLSLIGMLRDMTYTLGSGWSSGKTFAFTLMTLLAFAGIGLLLLAALITVKGLGW